MEKDHHKKLMSLIRIYSQAARDLLASLKNCVQVDGPVLHAYRSGLLEQTGNVSGLRYEIHGGGISISDGSKTVDIELGQNDFTGAFDAWRLAQFAQTLDDQKFSDFVGADAVRLLLVELRSSGLVEDYEYLGQGFFTLPEFVRERTPSEGPTKR